MAERGAVHPARVALVAILALSVAAQVLRTAAVADRERRPGLAAVLWSAHPAVLTDKVLLDVASAAAHGRAVPAATRADVRRIARRAPLSPNPFLIEAAIAATKNKGAAAEQLLLAARKRDPRSRATRFLLADRYLRTNRVTAALVEMHVLVGLHGRGGEPFFPMLVAYARTPGSARYLKPFFKQYPRIESAVLSMLAVDARNADLVLSLASGQKPEPDWRGPLVSALVAAGDYSKAYAIWRRINGLQSPPGLFNPSFAETAAPGPFDWHFPQTPEGIAEPDGKAGLDVLYYGRAQAVLASQLLLLDAGRYELAHRVADASGDAGSLHWVARCADPAAVLGDVPLRVEGVRLSFHVPAGCKAVWLELQGVPGEAPRSMGLTIQNVSLDRADR